MKKEYLKYLDNFKQLTLITSAGCNLNCKYCLISETVNESSKEIQKNTIKALQDGTFIENVKKIFLKFNLNLNEINGVDLWGQEPTLTLEHVTDHLEDWLKLFPNLRKTFFSTNGIAHSQKIIDFILKLDKILNKEYDLTIQFSYDGDYSTDNIRKANSKKIFDNLSFIINTLNGIKLKHVNVTFVFHGVLGMDLINELDTYEKEREYFNNMMKNITKVANINLNNKITVQPFCTINPEAPAYISTEDGLKWTVFIERIKKLLTEQNFQAPNYQLTLKSIMGHVEHVLYDFLDFFKNENAKNLNDVYNILKNMSEDELQRCSKQLSGFTSCGNNYCEFKIMYDGTLCNCQNFIYETKKEHLKNTDPFSYSLKTNLIDKGFFINPLTSTEEEIEKSFYLFNLLKTNSYFYCYSQIVALMYYLAQCNQINDIYKKDFTKILKQALALSPNNLCSYNNQITTGSMYNRHSGYIRNYCSGITNSLDILEKGENDLI